MVENTEIKELERLGWQLSWCIFSNEVERKEKAESEEVVRIRHRVINTASRDWREVCLLRVGADQRQFKGLSGRSCKPGPDSMGERSEARVLCSKWKPGQGQGHLNWPGLLDPCFFFFFKSWHSVEDFFWGKDFHKNEWVNKNNFCRAWGIRK